MIEQPPIPGLDAADVEELADFGEPVSSIDAPDEEVEAVEAAPEAEGEDIDAEAPEVEADEQPDYEALAQKAQQWEAWGERWARDPAAFMSTFFNAMTPDQKNQFLAATGAKAPEAEKETEYEFQSPVEELFLKERKQYAADRKALQDIPKFAETVNREFTLRDQFLNDVSIQANVLDAKLNAVLDLLDAKFPDVDSAAIQKALLSGKTYKEAVEKSYKPALEKAVKSNKQTAKPRPRTPSNASNSAIDISKEKDMTKIWRMLGS